MLRPALTILLLCCCHVVSWSNDDLTYEQHIRPIFREHCFDCHGAREPLEGGLDLRLVRHMLQGGDSGAAIVPGRADESLLLQRMLSGEMPPGESSVAAKDIDTITRWIAAGAPTARPEPESIGPGVGITSEERDFWAFRPIRRPALPAIPADPAALTPIDTLVLAAGGQMAPPADRRVLVIRAHMDLIGLPPTPEEIESWVNDSRDDWYDRLLTRLLDSPHYGERWARHWLDVAGYADSEGAAIADAERPWAWRYRDWVIRSLNADKPFDQYITEQLAGDELAGPLEGDLSEPQIELLTATGFLRMAPDGTGSGGDNPEGRNQVMSDTLKIIGTSLFALSLQCAQCHDHRYDPIPQTDYYSLRAVFEPALDWQAWKPPDARQISLYTTADRERAAEVESEAQAIVAAKAEKLAEYLRQALDQELAKFAEPLRSSLRDAYKTAAEQRSAEQKQLLEAHPSIQITPGNLYQYIPDSQPKLAEYDQRVAEVRRKKPLEQFLRVLVEPAGHVPETRLFHRGDHQQPKQAVPPASLSVVAPPGQPAEFSLDDESLPTTGRRLALARWLTGPQNPLLARVIVNRVWMHHFGVGIVATPADFGRLGALPSNPALLDWLADEFMAQGWSLKKLHRLILSSSTWRQQATPGSPDHARRTLLRLEAETIRDRMLAASGSLDTRLFGPPLKIQEDDTGQVVVAGQQTRRSLYAQVRRSRPVAMMQTFDAPVMETNCELRYTSTVATQSLMLLNGEFILEQAARLADRAASEAQPLAEWSLTELPELAAVRLTHWQYGVGAWDEQQAGTAEFTPLTHWTGSQWQGGASLPDATYGWALLHASGGHPDLPHHSVIRRWIAPADGVLQVDGSLAHPSEHGDGVRGRVVSSGGGLLGQWTAAHGSVATTIGGIAIRAGETLDFLVDCREHPTSDSFQWPVKITWKAVAGSAAETAGPAAERVFSSVDQFQGPSETLEAIAGQIARAWQLAYGRRPSREELNLAVRFVAAQMETFASLPAAVPAGRSQSRQALTNLCQALLGSNEFLYVE
jgi:mono/diheme cytochrome c family protein